MEYFLRSIETRFPQQFPAPNVRSFTGRLTEAQGYTCLMHEVYRYDEAGKKTHVNAKLKQELTSFAMRWFINLKDQGFLDEIAIRERLS